MLKQHCDICDKVMTTLSLENIADEDLPRFARLYFYREMHEPDREMDICEECAEELEFYLVEKMGSACDPFKRTVVLTLEGDEDVAKVKKPLPHQLETMNPA